MKIFNKSYFNNFYCESFKYKDNINLSINYTNIYKDGFIVQGFCVTSDYYIISAYSKGCLSRIYLYNRDGFFDKYVELDNKAHVGGLAFDNINRLLLNSGFTSFTIREKTDKPNYYEIVRSDGSIATNLSEGERNFLAFLYFHQQVLGFNNEEDEITQKIVVVDDPVSSMDSSALFIVSSLIRQMFTLCPGHYNKKESNIEISQIFVLTHNALFHHYVTAGYDDPRHYSYFSFFEVKKKNEISSIVPSLDERNGNLVNKNPQKSYYTSLWDAYNEVDSSNALITLMRQILNQLYIM